MIVHSYYTSGMHELAKIFVESFCYHHGDESIPLSIDAVGITKQQKDELIERYPFLRVVCHDYKMDFWSAKHNVPLHRLVQWKQDVEHNHVTQENRGWKLLIAGQQRVSAVRDFVLNFQTLDKKNPPLVVHFDIDTLFRAPIYPIIEEMMGYDVGLKLRPTIQPVKARITIDMMALVPTTYTIMWLSDWLRIINATPLLQRPIGFGQISCWEAYQLASSENRLKALQLPVKYGLPGLNKADHIVWCGNVHKLTKDDCAKAFREEHTLRKKALND